VGYQNVAGGGDQVKWIRVELCVFRLPSVETELLVTITKPLADPNEPPQEEETLPWSDAFQRVVSSLKIQDWGLFG
jgi:hypothetical protein